MVGRLAGRGLRGEKPVEKKKKLGQGTRRRRVGGEGLGRMAKAVGGQTETGNTDWPRLCAHVLDRRDLLSGLLES